jgi:phage-related protein
MVKFKVKFYETSEGRRVVKNFVNSLEAVTRSKVMTRINLLKEFGPKLSMPYAKPVGSGLFELRVRGKQEARVLYAYVKNDTIYLLHGFVKKTQVIPRKELRMALKRKKEVDSL